MRAGEGPLAGVRVVDLTTMLAGPYGTQLLADLGADVVKVERPRRGDPLRYVAPTADETRSVYFNLTNRNKRSVTLDLRHPEGRDLFLRLVDTADVVFENFRPGTMERLELGPEALRQRNTSLIYCDVSAFGNRGPLARLGGYDQLIQGYAGAMSVTGSPGATPMKSGVPIADHLAGIFAALGVLAALIGRARTGQAHRVSTSLLEAVLGVMTLHAAVFFGTGRVPEPTGNDHPLLQPYGTYRTADGYMTIAVTSDEDWRRLAGIVGLPPEVIAEFGTNARRVDGRERLREELEKVLAQRPSEEWWADFAEAELPAAPVLSVPDALRSPQARALGMLIELPLSGDARPPVPALRLAFRLSGAAGLVRRGPPGLGEHTREVLTEIGVDPSELERYVRAGIV